MNTIAPEKLRNQAIDAHQRDDLGQALTLYTAYLERYPMDARIWSNLGALFRKQGKLDLSVAAHRRCLELKPDETTFLNNAANAYYDAGLLEQSLEFRIKTHLADPHIPENHSMLGKAYRANHKHELSKDVLEKGILKFPNDTEIHIQLALTQLAMGDYPSGFKTFNWRWKGDELNLPNFPFPKWDGESLSGKTILLTPEQGFGDTVLMARFINGLKKLGPTIKLFVKPPLRQLFRALKDNVTLVETNSETSDCDFWCPMMDLPLYLKTTLDNIPPPIELHIPQNATERAKRIVAPYTNQFKIGVLWSGSITYRANKKRSFSHDRFLELCDIPNIQLFSLYKGPLLKQYIDDGTSAIILNASGNDRNFADTAALMKELDLIISMDSAIVHIAGSMGLEVWNLLHSEAYWLYEPFQDHTPWYPSMKLFRQSKPGDWDSVFTQIKSEIINRIKDKSNR